MRRLLRRILPQLEPVLDMATQLELDELDAWAEGDAADCPTADRRACDPAEPWFPSGPPDVFIPPVMDIRAAAASATYQSGRKKRTRYRRRKVADVTTIVIHQMGVERSASNARWPLVTAHRVIRTDAARLRLHDLDVRLIAANALDRAPHHAANIEVAGNFEQYDGEGNWWRPDAMGRGRASLEQLVALAFEIKAIANEVAAAGGRVRLVAPHIVSGRSRKGTPNKPLCPGSRVWQAAEYTALLLGLAVPTEDEAHGGTPVPLRWRSEAWHKAHGRRWAGWADDLSEEEKVMIHRAVSL